MSLKSSTFYLDKAYFRIYSICSCITGKIRKLGFMQLPQSQHNNVKLTCIIWSLGLYEWSVGRCESWPRLIMCTCWPSISLLLDWCRVRTGPPFSCGGHGCIFNLSPEPCLVSTQNCCHMGLSSAWSVLAYHHHFHQHQLPLLKNPTRERE